MSFACLHLYFCSNGLHRTTLILLCILTHVQMSVTKTLSLKFLPFKNLYFTYFSHPSLLRRGSETLKSPLIPDRFAVSWRHSRIALILKPLNEPLESPFPLWMAGKPLSAWEDVVRERWTWNKTPWHITSEMFTVSMQDRVALNPEHHHHLSDEEGLESFRDHWQADVQFFVQIIKFFC